jgi:gamma-glutamylcyclotransferase (GGCT)/AIG2-like uncharacterized protein YtfP
MNKRYYFAYGANMNPDSMARRCPGATNPCGFVLRDYELKFYSHATVEPAKGSKVFGMLWEITEQCEHNLDSFEGFPHYYTKVGTKQSNRDFFFYVMTDFKSGEPSSGYVNDIFDVYKRYGFPQEYLEQALADVIYSNY